MILDKQIALFNVEAKDRDDAFKILSDEFVKAGVVEDNFLEGLQKREANFPTGLLLDNREFGVAIPHTDSEYVKRTQIGFMTLKEPVEFSYMADPDVKVPVRIMFMLAIKEAHAQVEMLSKLMELFWDDERIDRMLALDNKEDFEKLMTEFGIDQF